MKYKIHVPTEQYGFCEVEIPDQYTLEAVAQVYREVSEAFKPRPVNSLPDKEYNHFIDNMLLGSDNHLETYYQMSPDQQKAVQILKKALKRLKAHEQE